MSITGPECCLGNIRGLDTDLMVSRTKINLGKDGSTSELIQKVINSGQRILVLNGDLIKLTIINAQAHSTVFLFD